MRHVLAVFTAALFLTPIAAATGAVTLRVGQNTSHTLTVYNPLDTADTIRLQTAVTGNNPDTFTISTPRHDLRRSVTVRIPAETNRSFPVTVAASYCTAQTCTATLTFTAVSDTTALTAEKTVDLTAATGEEDTPRGTSTGTLAVIAATLFVAVAAAALILRRVLLATPDEETRSPD